MSKVGRRPIPIAGIEVKIDGQKIAVKGPKGQMEHELPRGLEARVDGNELRIERASNVSRAMWGLHRALLANKILGVKQGFERRLKIVGLGYKAQVSGKKVVLTLGFSHKIEYEVPEGVSVETDKAGQLVTVKSIDKQLLGQVCAEIRSFKKPEPYKGTGIMYEDEVIIRKAGKAGA